MFISFFVSFTFKLGNFADFKTFFADRFSLTGPSQELKTPWNNLLQGGNGQGQNQGSKLTFPFGSQPATNGKFWSPDRKFWSPTYFMYNLHKDTILNVTLHPRKVTTEV